MQHHQPTSSSQVLHLAYLPGAGSAFVLPLITRLNAATSPALKAARATWPQSELADYGMAVSTKLAMLSLIGGRVYGALAALYAELADQAKVAEHLKGGFGWMTANRQLPYEILLEVDCFLFEFRSCYEIVGEFLRRFFKTVLGQELDQSAILARLSEAGVDVAWIKDLQEHRILFFHKTAPWLAISIDTPSQGDRELVILHGPKADPTNPAEALTFSRLRAIHGGLEASLQTIHEWALGEIRKLDVPPAEPSV